MEVSVPFEREPTSALTARTGTTPGHPLDITPLDDGRGGEVRGEETRLRRITGKLASATLFWEAAQRDAQIAATQHEEFPTAETQRALMQARGRERAASVKIARALETRGDDDARCTMM